MALQEGQIWKCWNPDCGGEVRVIKSARAGKEGSLPIRCCCGNEMHL